MILRNLSNKNEPMKPLHLWMSNLLWKCLQLAVSRIYMHKLNVYCALCSSHSNSNLGLTIYHEHNITISLFNETQSQNILLLLSENQSMMWFSPQSSNAKLTITMLNATWFCSNPFVYHIPLQQLNWYYKKNDNQSTMNKK